MDSVVSITVLTTFSSCWGDCAVTSKASRYIRTPAPCYTRIRAKTLGSFVNTRDAMVNPKGIWEDWKAVSPILKAKYFQRRGGLLNPMLPANLSDGDVSERGWIVCEIGMF